MTNLIPAEFHGESIQLIEKDGVRWLTARDVGLCLGYNQANAKDGVLSSIIVILMNLPMKIQLRSN